MLSEEELRAKRREAGRKGGLAKNPNKGYGSNPALAKEVARRPRGPRKKS
jgi:hypothetical protein